jgi:cyclopropane-fatty-acyl-phospholipid synthase
MAEQMLSEVEAGIRFHYDLPPEFFQLFLDRPTMSYTCAYFRDAHTSLEEAQRRKLELVARKLQLKPGDHLLDIGLGWGNMAFVALERGCHVTGITLAQEQAAFVRGEAERRGYSDRLEIVIEEAGRLPFPDATFDNVVTIGATEQTEDIELLFQEVSRVMRDDALFLQHSMTAPYEPVVPSPEAEFLQANIFPTGRIKPLRTYLRAFEEAHLEVVDVHDITDHYPHTLERWLRNLEASGADAATAVGVPAERWRAQRLFLAGCIAVFDESHILCYQELLRRVSPGRPRRPLPASRSWLRLDDGPSQPLMSPAPRQPVVELRVGEEMRFWVEGGAGPLVPGAPPREPDCTLAVSSQSLQQVVSGEVSLADAYLRGDIDVQGNLVAAVQVRLALMGLAQ